MAKVLIDTNVILRYILNDNENMAIEAENIIKNGAITLPEVLAEVVYVLKRVYEVEKVDIVNALLDILNEVEVEHHDTIVRAVQIFSESNLDFVDCILIAYHEVEGIEVFSFDKKLNNKLSTKNKDTASVEEQS